MIGDPGPVAIAIDLGGTRSRVAAVANDGKVMGRIEFATKVEGGPQAILQSLAQGVESVRNQLGLAAPVGLGVAAPGPIDHRTGVILQAPHLQWDDPFPLTDKLQSLTGIRTFVANDANLAALGEARHGAGRGAENLIYLTVSTGIGSGMVVHGRLLLGQYGAAAEAGHMIIRENGRLCHCGAHGCLEAYASGTALAERALEAIRAGRSSALARYADGLEAEEVALAADEGDALANELIADAGVAMGIGIRNLLHLFDPLLVVLGGGVTNIGSRFWDPMLATVRADPYAGYAGRARIERAALGDDQGLIGAGVWVHEQLAGAG